MRNPPPEVYLSWPAPNYADPETRGPMLVVVPVVLVIISFLIVVLRLYTRFVLIKSIGADDWLIGAATCTSIALAALTIHATRYGWGLHIWDNRPEWYVGSRLFSWLSQIMFATNSGLIKSSILLSYLRIAPNRGFRYSVYVSLFVVAGVAFGVGMSIVFTCSPVHGYWDHTVKSKCIKDSIMLLTGSVINTCTDFWVAFLPAPMLMRVWLPLRQKIILVFLFGFAGLVCVAGICRTIALHKTMFETYDVTWHGALALVWSAVETDVGIATASIPALRPLFHYYFPHMLGTNRSADYSSHGAGTYDPVRASKNPNDSSVYPLSTIGGSGPESQDPIAGTEEGHGKLYHRASVESNSATMCDKDSRGGGDNVGGVPAKATSGV